MKKDVRLKFEELFGISRIRENICPLNIEVEEITERDGFKQIRFTFESEIGSVIPCYLLVPNGKINKYPVAIELQGHISGFHNSIGVAKYDDDIEKYFPRYNMGLQAVKNGFAALCIEQRGMGENGYLKSITERTKIKDFKYTQNGEDWFPLAEDTLVSMNLWGFTPGIFDILEEKFEEFKSNIKDPMKDEFFLPFAVDESIKSGDATVKEFNCKDKWYGMTYREDIYAVKEAMKKMIEEGHYDGL